MSKRVIKVVSRDSALAMWQTNFVVDSLRKVTDQYEFEIVSLKTKGDKVLDVSLAKIGDKGLFTKELEDGLLSGEMDFAVHSLKDIPTVLPEGLQLSAMLTRHNPADVLISEKYDSFDALPQGAKVGTSSLRRKAQLLNKRPDLNIQDLRGNVNTRMRKLKEENFDGIILAAAGVEKRDFNTFGSRRGNDLVMARGTFANVRIKNLLTAGVEGGYTLYFGTQNVSEPDTEIAADCGTPTFIYDAGMAYKADGVPTIIIGGEDYGMGSSRDWAAKGTSLLGVRAVITKSFERIHRSNLIGMGVLPLNFANAADYDRVKDLKDATFSIVGLSNDMEPRSAATLVVTPAGAESFELPLVVRIDTPIEKEYFRAGGILQYVLTRYC